MNPPIVILTDFGTTDPYVGIMKGVITKIAPLTPVIDLTNEIPLGDIQQGAVTLWQSINYFASGSIFLVVIDPGVGTSRRSIILQNGHHTFIAPDNGVLSFVDLKDFNAWEISNPQFTLPNPGKTFHGRDIFAPAAAHASLGIKASKFGNKIQNLEILDFPQLESSMPGKLTGQILYPDRFGNLITSLGKFTWSKNNHLIFKPWVGKITPFSAHPETLQLELQDGMILPWAKTFADIPPGDCAILTGSSGLLEIVANRQSAANLLNLSADEPITLRFEPTT
ncbi:S-adenosyl-l-methionine hydroxide adenosyltransferase family protein [Chloroflexota bacterium]